MSSSQVSPASSARARAPRPARGGSEQRPPAPRRKPEPSGFVLRCVYAVGRSRAFHWLVRIGFLARGITYGVIGALAGLLAFGVGHGSGDDPNQEGALVVIGRAPLGRALLIVLAVSLLAYALWKLGRGLVGDRGPEGGGGTSLKDRVSDLGGGVAYLAFFAVSVRVLLSVSADSSVEQRQAARGILSWGIGPALVTAAGVGLLCISLYQIYDALRAAFRHDNKVRDMTYGFRRTFLILGRVGLTARSVVFGLAGYFLVRTALDYRITGLGLNGALAQLHARPFGRELLAGAAAGLIVFAVFSLLEARFQRL